SRVFDAGELRAITGVGEGAAYRCRLALFHAAAAPDSVALVDRARVRRGQHRAFAIIDRSLDDHRIEADNFRADAAAGMVFPEPLDTIFGFEIPLALKLDQVLLGIKRSHEKRSWQC